MRSAVVVGLLAIVLGVAGLVRGALPDNGSTAAPPGGSTAPLAVTDAWIQAPAPPTTSAAGYFTVYNNTDQPVQLLSVATAAGATTTLHTGDMEPMPGGVSIPARGRFVLSVGQGHLMIENLFGDLKAGQHVSMQLTFDGHDPITVSALVYAPGDHP